MSDSPIYSDQAAAIREAISLVSNYALKAGDHGYNPTVNIEFNRETGEFTASYELPENDIELQEGYKPLNDHISKRGVEFGLNDLSMSLSVASCGITGTLADEGDTDEAVNYIKTAPTYPEVNIAVNIR